VGIVDRKQRLFDAIVRLRRAERRIPPNEDIVAVRAMLEEELGATMSRRLAARVLGVDHKSLDRWIRSGDLPVVETRSGRTEVPVTAVAELYDAVSEERAIGTRSRHHLEPSLTAGRRRAENLRPHELVEGAGNGNGNRNRNGHGRAERRSLAYHRALAKRLRRPMVDDALKLVWQWRDTGRIDHRYAAQWEDVLRRPVADVRRIISEDSERGRDLRQNSPFAGMLSEAERRRINDEVR
jgi:hypothetical protein